MDRDKERCCEAQGHTATGNEKQRKKRKRYRRGKEVGGREKDRPRGREITGRTHTEIKIRKLQIQKTGWC